MSGASSHVSNNSNGSDSSRRRSGRFIGVPKKCWCGEQIVSVMSNSEHNPYRRYFCCSFAVAHKLVNDNHIFKWVDEALLNEVETLQFKTVKLEQDLKDIARECEVFEKMVFDTVQKKLEIEIFHRVEEALIEVHYGMKKMMILLVFVWLMVVGFMAFCALKNMV